MSTAILNVPIVYHMELGKRRGAGSKLHFIKEITPVEVRDLPDSPPLVEATFKRQAATVQWRTVHGEAYRTFFAGFRQNGTGVVDLKAFDEIVRLCSQDGYSPWDDLALRTDVHRKVSLPNFNGRVTREVAMSKPYGAVIHDGRDAAIEKAEKWARSVAVIGGVPHRTGAFPVWSVGPSMSSDIERYGEVNLVLPERVFASHGFFPYDARDEAEAYSRRLVERRSPTGLCASDDADISFCFPSPPVCQGTFARVAFGGMRYQGLGLQLLEMPSKLLIGLGKGEEASVALRHGLSNADALEDMEGAMALIASIKPGEKATKVDQMVTQARSFVEYREYMADLTKDDEFALAMGI